MWVRIEGWTHCCFCNSNRALSSITLPYGPDAVVQLSHTVPNSPWSLSSKLILGAVLSEKCLNTRRYIPTRRHGVDQPIPSAWIGQNGAVINALDIKMNCYDGSSGNTSISMILNGAELCDNERIEHSPHLHQYRFTTLSGVCRLVERMFRFVERR